MTGQPMLAWVTSYAQSWQRILEGDLEGAEQLANQALELGGATGQPDAMPIYGGQLVDLRWHQGRDAELVELIEQMVDSTPDIDSFRSALARIYADIGRTEDARQLLEREAEMEFAHPFDPLAATTIVMWAEVAIQTGDTGSARVLLSRLASFADQVVCNGVDIFGSLDHYRGALWGVLGRFDEAEPLLVRGAEIHEALGAPSSRRARTSSWPGCSGPATEKEMGTRRCAGPGRRGRSPAGTATPPSSAGPPHWADGSRGLCPNGRVERAVPRVARGTVTVRTLSTGAAGSPVPARWPVPIRDPGPPRHLVGRVGNTAGNYVGGRSDEVHHLTASPRIPTEQARLGSCLTRRGLEVTQDRVAIPARPAGAARRRGASTKTSTFGVSKREGHDASDFYSRSRRSIRTRPVSLRRRIRSTSCSKVMRGT